MKLVRFDEDHFGYLTDGSMSQERVEALTRIFQEWWPGKSLLVVEADSFADLTGQYAVVEIPPVSET
jgi:hypothetical protein